ncbi:lipoprotein [Lysobacter helvus]|uniref:Lipoprotein n=2 Tax=Lysobacteraceae TaxID=32033 RepID=A0ABN6FPD9_9GAMM|nr:MULTISPECIES: DUF4136 domain-containing protein [Lysobacter]BCT91135.1 lipoprotein [Lysobacter caseinilyticus]BCT94288.1 lipoprotein [Lysobacter helvus]
MRRAIRWLCSLVALVALVSCVSTPETRADYDKTVNFAQYRSFAFFDKVGTDDADYESLMTRQLKDSTRRELEARGYRYNESAPDLLVNFKASVTQQTRVHPGPMPYWGGYYGYGWPGYYGFWGGYYEPYVDQYDEGTLNIDIVDARRKQLVWEGVTTGRITDKARNNRSAAIDTAVRDMFTQFPFRAGGAPE